jgi:hypothetical protein
MEEKIIQWVQCDNKIKEYNDKSKKIKDIKNRLCNEICKDIDFNENKSKIPHYKLEGLNIMITPQESNIYENYNNKFYKECFSEYFQSEEKAEELLNFMKSKRKVSKSFSIKRINLI